MAKRDSQPSTFELPPQMTAAAPVITTVAISGPPPSEADELREQVRGRDEEIARLRAELDRASTAPVAVEPDIGAGSPVSLVEYRDGRIYETTATVVAQLADHRLQVRARGSHDVIEVDPHDGSRPASVNRIGWHGYQYEDPLQGPGLRGV